MDKTSHRSVSDRRSIYYWKCDRPQAFHGVLRVTTAEEDAALLKGVRQILKNAFSEPFELLPGVGEGTHRTFQLHHQEKTYFVRVEDGPEGDTHLETESHILRALSKINIPVPHVYFCDVSRKEAPFSVQVITHYPTSDLNRLYRKEKFSLLPIAEDIGNFVARWQALPLANFGPLEKSEIDKTLRGFHPCYADYFTLHLDRHFRFLGDKGFLASSEIREMQQAIEMHKCLLEIEKPCLVHKDLALWNILGTAKGIVAFIDWDDAIGGDVADDLSLLGCFYSWEFLQHALRGYERERPLPPDFSQRFWLHLLRNMLVKAVIRIGAGYFDQTQSNFLMAAGGDSLRRTTHEKLLVACRGLKENRPLTDL